ncbi:hypothetical protein G7046_g274 [Stylonectria norvegica]|nr:hypothetical protein G7046_g274 [Stylonectria norvegica]
MQVGVPYLVGWEAASKRGLFCNLYQLHVCWRARGSTANLQLVLHETPQQAVDKGAQPSLQGETPCSIAMRSRFAVIVPAAEGACCPGMLQNGAIFAVTSLCIDGLLRWPKDDIGRLPATAVSQNMLNHEALDSKKNLLKSLRSPKLSADLSRTGYPNFSKPSVSIRLDAYRVYLINENQAGERDEAEPEQHQLGLKGTKDKDNSKPLMGRFQPPGYSAHTDTFAEARMNAALNATDPTPRGWRQSWHQGAHLADVTSCTQYPWPTHAFAPDKARSANGTRPPTIT